MTNRLKLYHFTNKDISNISIDTFGDNLWTDRDKNVCNIKRSFFYLENKPIEKFFKGCIYCYTVEIDKGNIYDLKEDRYKFIDSSRYKFSDSVDIDKLLSSIKESGYTGIIYNTGYDVVCLFEDVEYNKKIKRR